MMMIVMNLVKNDQKVWIDCFAREETKQSKFGGGLLLKKIGIVLKFSG